MYSIIDYLHNGCLYLHNLAFPKRKRLSQLMIYSTTRCQSRCRHCSIYKKPDKNLSLEDIKSIMLSRCVTPRTTVGLEGGEFILHPQATEIMEWFAHNHPNYTLLSNGLFPGRVIEYVSLYQPSHLYLSLDGDRETYQRMRGRDGYDKVMRVVRELKDEVPISLMFCLSPWNSFEDMRFVIDVAKRNGIDIRIGIYGTMDFFDTTSDLLTTKTDEYIRNIPGNIHKTEENYDFVALYDEWRNGRLKLRCQSIFSCLVIHADGEVPLCQNLGVSLGNIHTKSLDEIFNSTNSRDLQRKYSAGCNGCWINFHRKYDIILVRNLERFLPKRVIELFYGKYNWTGNHQETYKSYIKRIYDISNHKSDGIY